MKILSVSTATNFLTISLNEDEKVIKQVEEKDQRNHSEHLDPMIDKLLKDCNLSLKQIDRLAVAIGPGSYTGLRIGITTMKMFASILNKEEVILPWGQMILMYFVLKGLVPIRQRMISYEKSKNRIQEMEGETN